MIRRQNSAFNPKLFAFLIHSFSYLNLPQYPQRNLRVISVITGEIKSKIDQIWDAFASGGISNPLEVIEQMTYLLFIRRLDEIQITKEKKANRLKLSVEKPIFTPEQDHLRWSKFITLGDPTQLYSTIANEVFPFIKSIGSEDDTTYSHHMKDARFTIPNAAF